MTIPGILEEKLSAALKAVLGADLPADFRATVAPSADLRFGDYQSNAAMVLAKQCRTNPRALAQQVVDQAGEDDVCSLEIAGPGFINFRIKPEFYASRLLAMLADERLGVEQVRDPKTIVIDFSAPNVAKPMHVGHIRSTIIGDALSRVARFVGHKVITDNHIGDWGTQFGMILWGWKNILDEQALEANPIDELLRVYKDVNLMCKEKPELLDTCKAELVKLQAGDEENLAIWKRCVEVSKSGLSRIYDQLDIHFDYWLGESFYNDALAPLVDGMIAAGMARESDGAICVFSDGSVPPNEDPFLVQEKGEWRANPCIIRKADGGFLYATTDLATLDHRIRTWGADSIWYVVGAPQALHFRQIFSAQRRRGMEGDYRHIAFGSILGDDRKPFKTRSGDTVSLQDVLDEAIERAARKKRGHAGRGKKARFGNRRHRRREICGTLPEPDDGLRIQLGQNAGPPGGHGSLPSELLRARPLHFQEAGRRSAGLDRSRGALPGRGNPPGKTSRPLWGSRSAGAGRLPSERPGRLPVRSGPRFPFLL